MIVSTVPVVDRITSHGALLDRYLVVAIDQTVTAANNSSMAVQKQRSKQQYVIDNS